MFLGKRVQLLFAIFVMFCSASLYPAAMIVEPVQACIINRDAVLNDALRQQIAQCLGWQPSPEYPICNGYYQPITVEPLVDPDEIRIWAKEVAFYNQGKSQLRGNVEVRQLSRIVNAQTAYVYRNEKTNEVTKIELFGGVRVIEPGRVMIAKNAIINPQNNSGTIEDVVYRFNAQHNKLTVPAWGQASKVERYANEDYFLQKATYSTCPPPDKAWRIEAKSIAIDSAHSVGVARDAKLVVGKIPVFYSPYLNFPTSKDRKSGFLFPTSGYSNIGGFDFSLPYYWNIAPNYDATIVPHLYTQRGVMLGGEFRYLTESSRGLFDGHFLPNDKAYKSFLLKNQQQYPQFQDESSDRWAWRLVDSTMLYRNLQLHVDYQQVSDDYYMQDFSNNLAVLTRRQLLRQGDLTYTTDHWLLRGMLQGYQTLKPINETPVGNIYSRLPQLLAQGTYNELPFNANFTVLGQYDQYHWPDQLTANPEGPRYHLNPVLSLPQMKPWGYFTPSIELVENYYNVSNNLAINNAEFNRTIPRYNVDSGLFFERQTTLFNQVFTQTLEPRLYYLYVPFHNQAEIPVYDSGYMIFNANQLFRTNRFSGFDRIGDGNQLSYAVSTRWISDQSGSEKASLTVGQIRYFADRQVQLCQSNNGQCTDNPLILGYLSPLADYSPLATRAAYQINRNWAVVGDYVWDQETHSTNNGNLNFHYQPGENRIVNFGYSYLVNGDITQVANSAPQYDPLHQITAAYAWPINDRWSTLGAYAYNISKNYDMMTLLGVQYDNCCWAMRLVAGKSFLSLDNQLNPQYNNNIYLQFLLKGLGAVGNSDPASTIRTFLPSYADQFH